MKQGHITSEEWQRFFGQAVQDMGLYARIREHAAGCEECRNLWHGAQRLHTAAGAYRQASRAGESAYAAVASADAASAAHTGGSLTVDIDVYGGEAVFVEDSVEASGNARKYAMNLSPDQQTLREDLDALTLQVRDGMLYIRVEDALCGRVQASMRICDQVMDMTFDGCEASAALPQDEVCVLEIIFAP